MKAANAVVLLFVTSLVAGCSGGGGGGGTADPGSFTVTTSTTTLELRQGESGTIDVNVVRVDPFAGEVAVSLSALPSSVTATSAMIPEGSTSATITVTAAADAPQGEATIGVSGVDSTGQLTDATTLPLLVKGQPGARDTTWGDAEIPVGTSDDLAFGMAMQADGKLVVVGSTIATDLDVLVLRFEEDGTLDAGFGTDGKLVLDLGDVDQMFGVRVLADGSILTCGSSAGEMAVARITPDGAPDTTFGGGDGFVLVPFTTNPDTAFALDVLPSGAILLAGLANDGASNNFGVAKLDAMGALDTTFNSTGKLTRDFFGQNDIARGIVSLPDGTILVGGNASETGNADFVIVKLSATGVADVNFGSSGIARADFGGATESMFTMAVQPDGKILAGGQGGTTFDWAMARFTDAGAPDITWAGDGTLLVDLTSTSSIRTIGLDTDGGMFVAGDAGLGGNNEFAFGRFDALGVADPAFGTGGLTQVDLGSAASGAFAGVLTGDGRFVAAGSASNGTDADVGVARVWL